MGAPLSPRASARPAFVVAPRARSPPASSTSESGWRGAERYGPGVLLRPRAKEVRRLPTGKSARPNRTSKTVIAVVHTEFSGWASSHSTTRVSGRFSISAEMTFVSRMITA